MMDTIIATVLVIVTNGDGTFPKGYQYTREHQGDLTCADIMDQEEGFLAEYGNAADQYCLDEKYSMRPIARPEGLGL